MKKFWNWIKNSDDTRILRLEGPIDEESFWGDEITPQMFRDELESGEGDVTVWINSPGGNVFAAAEIYTMLKRKLKQDFRCNECILSEKDRNAIKLSELRKF